MTLHIVFRTAETTFTTGYTNNTMRISTILTAAIASSYPVFGAEWIVSGAVWKDTDGNTIDAHGGGIVQRGDTFYWVGQSSKNSNYA